MALVDFFNSTPRASGVVAAPVRAVPNQATPLVAPQAGAEGDAGGGVGAPIPAQHSVSSFVNAQSLVTFPGASAVVLILWQVGQTLFDLKDKTNTWTGFIIALVVGGAVYLISMNDNTVAKPRQLAVGILIAFINSVFLFAGAVGIGTLRPGNPAKVVQAGVSTDEGRTPSRTPNTGQPTPSPTQSQLK